MPENLYVDFVRSRITELRIVKNISERKMSQELDKSDSYIRGITNGTSLPSLKELFNIIIYFNMTPLEFFAPLADKNTPYQKLCERLQNLDDDSLEKINTFVDWIDK